MKKRRFIIPIVTILILIIGFIGIVFWKAGSSPQPMLEFESYERSATNGAQFARLNLRNTTSKPIWLIFHAWNSTPTPEFLEHPIVLPRPSINLIGTFEVGHFYVRCEEVLPGHNLEMEFPLVAEKGPEQVGVSYYAGKIKDGLDLYSNIFLTSLPDNRASLKDKVEFNWDKFERKWKAPKCYEVWCPQPLSFQTGKATNSAK